MITHSKACQLAFEIYNKELTEWLSRWGSTYCRECGGYGQVTDTFDPSPSHASLGPGWMEESGPCSSCTLCDADHPNPLCPRCMAPWPVIYDEDDDPICLIAEQGLPCPSCGWNWGKNLDDALPVEPICFCEDGPDTDTLGVMPAPLLFVDELPTLLPERRWKDE